ncbi:MAG TPA: DUF2254 domain-containing protein [Methylophilaceae bacterium]|nr:DUF2254 domain-containing protein [Methylophilaceae bacterium]
MKTFVSGSQLRQIRILIGSSLWFVPAVMVLASAALAVGLIEMDLRYSSQLKEWWPRLFKSEVDGAREMLSTIATATITVAGVVFSITIVALALASTQYTSRVLRNFMRDKANQVVLGSFVGIYTYCLLVLRILSGGDQASVPSLAVFGGLVLALIGIVVFIFFIHHISSSIQAGEIIAAITFETLNVVDKRFPDRMDKTQGNHESKLTQQMERLEWNSIPASCTGYVQTIDAAELLAYAIRKQIVLHAISGAGDFVIQGKPLAFIAGKQPASMEDIEIINGMYAIDRFRTVDQDPAFGLRQLVDIALKALSPAINDTTTAVICVEHISVILQRLADRNLQTSYGFEGEELRFIGHGPDFESLISLGFDQILENGEGNTAILSNLLGMLESIAEATTDQHRRAWLIRYIEVISEVVNKSAKTSYAQHILQSRITQLKGKLHT